MFGNKMAKSALLQARIEPALKKQGEEVLRQIGISNTEFMTMTFRQLVMRQGLPFDARIPNDETVAAIREYEKDKNSGKLSIYSNSSEMLTGVLGKQKK